MTDSREYLDVLREAVESGREASMIITGNSMAPFLYHGRDVIYFSSPKRPLKRGDMAFFRRADGSYVMHRIVRKRTSDCFFLGDNQTDIEGPIPDSLVFAVVTRVKRKGRILGPHSLWWLFFKHIWINMIPLRHPVMDLYRRLLSSRSSGSDA